MLGRAKEKLKLNNSGAALVTVIIVIAFVSILVTVILYTTGINYHMKTADKLTKDSFYEAEIAMESIRADFMIEAKKAFQEAYRVTMNSYMAATDRNQLFEKTFEDTLNANFTTYIAGSTLEDYIRSKVPSTYRDGLSVSSSALVNSDVGDGKIVLQGVSVRYTKDGYTAMITTDFMIKPPEFNWALDENPADWDSTQHDVTTAFERKIFEMDECVIYYNWKKE